MKKRPAPKSPPLSPIDEHAALGGYGAEDNWELIVNMADRLITVARQNIKPDNPLAAEVREDLNRLAYWFDHLGWRMMGEGPIDTSKLSFAILSIMAYAARASGAGAIVGDALKRIQDKQAGVASRGNSAKAAQRRGLLEAAIEKVAGPDLVTGKAYARSIEEAVKRELRWAPSLDTMSRAAARIVGRRRG
jgi:hypothetical protein